MDIVAGSIRCGPWWNTLSMVIALVTLGASVDRASAAESTSAQRFQLSGTGSLRIDQPAQKSGAFSVRAYLTPKDAALAVSPSVQESGRFVVMGSLVATAQVCYNDTIFRDDFDGDGG